VVGWLWRWRRLWQRILGGSSGPEQRRVRRLEEADSPAGRRLSGGSGWYRADHEARPTRISAGAAGDRSERDATGRFIIEDYRELLGPSLPQSRSTLYVSPPYLGENEAVSRRRHGPAPRS
jgi:hypothetical protein